MSTVDLRELAIDRDSAAKPALGRRRHLLTRYVLPAGLLVGFVLLATWASWELVFPPKSVTVVPVLATRAEVQRAGTPLFKAAGWIEPRPTPVRVAALAPGVVERLLVVEDQEVKAGEPLAELVKDDARLAFERARADLKLREAELQEAKATLTAAKTRFEQPVHLQAALSEAESALAQVETQLKNLPHQTHRAEAQRELAQKSVATKRGLKGVISGLTISQSESELLVADAQVAEFGDRKTSLDREKSALSNRRDALKKQLDLLIDETRARDEAGARVNAAESRVELAQVAVDEAKLRCDRMTIHAPIAGRVYRLIGHPGTTLTGGMGYSETYDGSTVVTLYRPDMLQVRVDVRFEDIPHVALLQPVTIENPALKVPLAGKVLFVSSQANIQKNTLEVKVAIDAPPAVFRPEMLVNVTFQAPAETGAPQEPTEEMRLYLPQQVVHRDDNGAFVWLADQSEGRAHRVSVATPAAASNGLIQIQSGLTESSRIIVDGAEDLRDGDRIQIRGEAAQEGFQSAGPESGKHAPLDRLPTGESH